MRPFADWPRLLTKIFAGMHANRIQLDSLLLPDDDARIESASADLQAQWASAGKKSWQTCRRKHMQVRRSDCRSEDVRMGLAGIHKHGIAAWSTGHFVFEGG